MKKRIATLTALIIALLSLFGCAKTGGQDVGEQSGGIEDKRYVLDYHYGSLAALGTSNSILETDNSVYYLYENMIYFSDKDYKDWLPLCVKPNCSHSDKDCDAYIDGAESGIWIYDQYIYYVDPFMIHQRTLV